MAGQRRTFRMTSERQLEVREAGAWGCCNKLHRFISTGWCDGLRVRRGGASPNYSARANEPAAVERSGLIYVAYPFSAFSGLLEMIRRIDNDYPTCWKMPLMRWSEFVGTEGPISIWFSGRTMTGPTGSHSSSCWVALSPFLITGTASLEFRS